MSQFPQDDDLVQFLRQHHPVPPPASPDLEDRILQAIAATPAMPTAGLSRRSLPRRRVSWLVPSAIAAGLVATVVGYRVLMPPNSNTTDMANLATFLENNWGGTVTGSTNDDTPLFGDLTTN